MRNSIIVDNLTSVELVEIVKNGGKFLEVFEVFFCHNLGYKPYTESFTDMFEKRDLFKSKKTFASKPGRKDRIDSLRVV